MLLMLMGFQNQVDAFLCTEHGIIESDPIQKQIQYKHPWTAGNRTISTHSVYGMAQVLLCITLQVT